MIDFIKIIDRFKFLKIASEIAKKRSEEIYIVGGFVRDTLLKRERNEIDFVIVGNGIEFTFEFARRLGVFDVAVYKNYGTAHFRFDNLLLEFVGARKESYIKESRNPIVKIGTLEDDLNRRDFTINTLAISLNYENYGDLVDRFNGSKDIEKKNY